jgi:ubiquitin-protein ligase
MAHKRLARELLFIRSRGSCGSQYLAKPEWCWDGAIDGWHAAPLVNEAGEENIMVWILKICGPADTPYYGGTFCCRLEFEKNYPFKGPKVAFETKIFHPMIQESHCIHTNFLAQGWSPVCTIPDVARFLMKLLREPEIFSDNGGWHRTNLYCRDLSMHSMQDPRNPAAFMQQARNMTLKHAFGAHSLAMSLVYSAAAASSICIGRKSWREFRIMRHDAHVGQRQRALDSAPLQLSVTQRTRMLCFTCSCPLSFLAFRMALAFDQYGVGFRRLIIALVMKRCFRRAAWQLWTRFC